MASDPSSTAQLWHIVAARLMLSRNCHRADGLDVGQDNLLGHLGGITWWRQQAFFLSYAEASTSDPQQRLLLETSADSFDKAGFSRGALSGSDTAVVLAISNTDWAGLQFIATGRSLSENDATGNSVYAATGAAISVAAGRLAFTFGLHGPCESIDTACSSSIAAAHLATLHLQAFVSTSAQATTTTLILAPHVSTAYARAGMLSTDGRCKTFDILANGYARGEGVSGMALVLADSCGECGRVLGSISGSVIRQDGVSASLTAPNGSAQVRLVELAIVNAVCARESYARVEAHGTGTPLGDPTGSCTCPGTRVFHMRITKNIMFTRRHASTGHEPAAGMLGFGTSSRRLRDTSPKAQRA